MALRVPGPPITDPRPVLRRRLPKQNAPPGPPRAPPPPPPEHPEVRVVPPPGRPADREPPPQGDPLVGRLVLRADRAERKGPHRRLPLRRVLVQGLREPEEHVGRGADPVPEALRQSRALGLGEAGRRLRGSGRDARRRGGHQALTSGAIGAPGGATARRGGISGTATTGGGAIPGRGGSGGGAGRGARPGPPGPPR